MNVYAATVLDDELKAVGPDWANPTPAGARDSVGPGGLPPGARSSVLYWDFMPIFGNETRGGSGDVPEVSRLAVVAGCR